MAWRESPRFQRERAELRKHYHHLDADLAAALEHPGMRWRPVVGTRNLLQKGRVRSRDIPGGQRGGFRVIRAVHGDNQILVSIYAKPRRADLTRDQYEQLVDDALVILAEIGLIGPRRRR